MMPLVLLLTPKILVYAQSGETGRRQLIILALCRLAAGNPG